MNRKLRKITPSYISYKLSFFVSVMVIVGFTLLVIYNFLMIKSEVTRQTHTAQYAQAQFIAKDIKNKIAERAKFLDGLVDIIPSEIIQSKNLLLDTLKKNQNLTDFFPHGFAVITPDGKSLIAEYPVLPDRNKLKFNHSEWFIRAKNIDEVVISVPFLSRSTGGVIVVIAKALRDENGHVLAVLESPVFLNRPGLMEYVFDKNHRPQGDILVISRANEVFVASSNPKLLLKPTPKRGLNKFHDEIMQGFNGYDKTTNAFGKEMLSAAADISEPDWFVVVRMPVDQAYQALNERLHHAIVNGILVSLIAVFTITFILFIFFTPLRQAAISVRKMVSNEQTLTHIKGYKHDEIGDLIIGFNALIDMVGERNDNLEKANTALESLSRTDGLTAVANRRYFDHTLKHKWRVSIRLQKPITLILIDIDYFKNFNDTYGHIEGDACLKKVARALQNSINRPTDFFARYGGEEFVILLEGDLQEGILVSEKARLAVSNLKIAHSESVYCHVTVSLGIASVVPLFESKSVELVKQADLALYQSKEGGRNRSECFKADL